MAGNTLFPGPFAGLHHAILKKEITLDTFQASYDPGIFSPNHFCYPRNFSAGCLFLKYKINLTMLSNFYFYIFVVK